MNTELTTRSHSTKQPAILRSLDDGPFFQHMREVYDTLARRAYELFDDRGRQDGRDLEDWFRAESELLTSTPVEVDEADDQLIVQADVPGFRDHDIEVRVEPRRLIISGKREQSHDGTRLKTIYSERRSNELFRVLDLSQEINPEKVRATLQDGRLEISLPKARPARNVPITAKAA